MDRKTWASIGFVAGVAALVGARTLGDPALRAWMFRPLRGVGWTPPAPLEPEQPLPPPAERPTAMTARVDPTLGVASPLSYRGRSDEGDRVPYADFATLDPDDADAKSQVNAFITRDDTLLVRIVLGAWYEYVWLAADLQRSGDAVSIARIEGGTWIDLRGGDRDESLHDIAGEFVVDSLDWTPGHTIAIRLDLDFNYHGVRERWCQLVVEGTAPIQAWDPPHTREWSK